MILYSLLCDNDHGFDAWFRSSGDFDTQSARGFVSCPICGSSNVLKTLMAPAVSTSKRRRAEIEPAKALPDAPTQMALSTPDPKIAEALDAIRCEARGSLSA